MTTRLTTDHRMSRVTRHMHQLHTQMERRLRKGVIHWVCSENNLEVSDSTPCYATSSWQRLKTFYELFHVQQRKKNRIIVFKTIARCASSMSTLQTYQSGVWKSIMHVRPFSQQSCRTAEYGSFQRDLGCARAKFRVCKCAI